MIDFFFLVPIAIGMGLAGLAAFMWTLRNDQYDDLEGAAQRILFEGNEGPLPVGEETLKSAGSRHPKPEQPPKTEESSDKARCSAVDARARVALGIDDDPSLVV
jgi:cbb3-type cytochrome oxidase maturation protein